MVISIILSIAKKIQRYTIFCITVNALHIWGGFSAHHQELKKTVHTASGMCLACLLLQLGWVSRNNSTYIRCSVYSFLSSWWWAEKPPETYIALTVIKN